MQEPSLPEERSSEPSPGDVSEDDKAEPRSQDDLLVGSITSKKYHLPDCRYAQKIKPENLISFQSIEDARDQGYLPCKVCNP
jgi:micrococcal nuclease